MLWWEDRFIHKRAENLGLSKYNYGFLQYWCSAMPSILSHSLPSSARIEPDPMRFHDFGLHSPSPDILGWPRTNIRDGQIRWTVRLQSGRAKKQINYNFGCFLRFYFLFLSLLLLPLLHSSFIWHCYAYPLPKTFFAQKDCLFCPHHPPSSSSFGNSPLLGNHLLKFPSIGHCWDHICQFVLMALQHSVDVFGLLFGLIKRLFKKILYPSFLEFFSFRNSLIA